MTAHRATRRLALLSLVAIVYQLNAGACGCLDHNGWYQAARGLLAADHGHGHGHSHFAPSSAAPLFGAPSSGDPAAEEAHCDGHFDTVYLVGRAVSLPDGAACKTGCSDRDASAVVEQDAAPCCFCLKQRSATTLAPGVRALAPVLLI